MKKSGGRSGYSLQNSLQILLFLQEMGVEWMESFPSRKALREHLSSIGKPIGWQALKDIEDQLGVQRKTTNSSGSTNAAIADIIKRLEVIENRLNLIEQRL